VNTISNIQLGLSRNEKCSKIRANKGHSNGENDEPWGWNRGTLVDWPSCALIFLAEKAWALCRWLFYHTGLFEHIPIGYGSIPIDTFLVGWTSINPSYELGFTRYQGFDPSPIGVQEHGHFDHPSIVNCSHTCTDTGFSDTVRILCDRILCLRMIVVLSSRPSTGVKQFNVANTSTNIIWFALMLYRRRVSWTDHVHSGFARCGPVGSLEVETQGWAQDGLQHKTGQDKTSWSVIPNGSSLTAWLVTWPIGHEHG